MAARDLAPSSSSRTPVASSSSRSGPAAPRPGLAARYRSLFVIGRGGMGTVEAALELQDEGSPGDEGKGYERVVALKRLLPDAARDARRVEMFLREAKLAAMLDHPNIVRAYDYGEVDGELFLAMEYVEGQALSRVLKALADAKAELGASLTAHVLAEACDGLHAAHELRDESGKELNLVHRDVSPQNVMVGCDGHVRLLDFGVAKIEAESSTKTGEVKGKTAYMSPEQAMGDAIDRRSDLFGVGAVLFECLALRRMWGDGTDMDVIRKLALEKPPRLEEEVPSAPPYLCALYMRLVAHDAKDRPATAHDVAEELRRLVPQGREEAARALQNLLELHFGAQAEQQRARLTSSLEEVAPGQAHELRQSVIPDLASSLGITRARPSTASIADATGANPVSASEAHAGSAGVAATSGREGGRTGVWLAVAVVVIAGVAVWRMGSGGGTASTGTAFTSTSSSPSMSTSPSTPPSPSPSTSTSTSTSTTLAPTLAPATTLAPTPTLAPATTLAPTLAPTPAFAPTLAPAPAPATTPPLTPRATAAQSTLPASRPSASAVPKPTVSPPASARPPPDVDDHPF